MTVYYIPFKYTKETFARLLATATQDEHKAALMRIVLEQYEPFETFKVRYAITQNIEQACKQIKKLYSMSSGERDIKQTIISVATYAKVLKRTGTNTYVFSQETETDYLQYIEDAIELKISDEIMLRNYLGDGPHQFISHQNVIQPLIDSVTKSKSDPLDTKAVVLYASSAFESFIDQYAQHKGVSLNGKNGIISKLTAFDSVSISKKHRGIIEYIGQVRNAAEHGSDANENNMTWSVSKETAIMYPLIVASAIKNILHRDLDNIIEV